MIDIPKIYFPITTVFVLITFSCKPSSNSRNLNGPTQESFKEVTRETVEAFNRKLDSVSVSRPEDVADIYRPALNEEEGRYTRRVSVRETGPEMLEVTLEETGLPDDAVEGIKILFYVKQSKNRYEVERIQEAYRCYRGHKAWNAEPCP